MNLEALYMTPNLSHLTDFQCYNKYTLYSSGHHHWELQQTFCHAEKDIRKNSGFIFSVLIEFVTLTVGSEKQRLDPPVQNYVSRK